MVGGNGPPAAKNAQEALVAQLSDRCVGGQFVFKADDWNKGRKTGGRPREPADLVWATNGVVVLMSMKSGKGAAKAQAQQGALRQLSGGLREWRSGRRLTGRSGDIEFQLPYEPASHVVLLALLEGDHLPVTVHEDRAKELGVAIVATIPEHLLHRLAWRRGGSRDLINVLVAARLNGGQLDGVEALGALDSLHSVAYTNSPFGRQPLNRTDPFSQALAEIVGVLRSVPASGSPARVRETSMPDALNPGATIDDLGWPGLFTTLGALHDPGAPRLFRPPDEDLARLQNGTIAMAQTMKAAGAEMVGVTTYAPPPPGTEPWPPDYIDSVQVQRLQNHTLVLGRAGRLDEPSFHRRWTEAWNSAIASAADGTPPLGIVLHPSAIGVGSIFCGSPGQRESATHRLLSEHPPS